MARVDWVYLDSHDGTAVCNMCRERETIPLPMSVNALTLWQKYFHEKHKDCKKRAGE